MTSLWPGDSATDSTTSLTVVSPEAGFTSYALQKSFMFFGQLIKSAGQTENGRIRWKTGLQDRKLGNLQVVSFHKAPDARDKYFRSLDNIIQTVFLQKFHTPFGISDVQKKVPPLQKTCWASMSLWPLLLCCSISSGHGEGLPFKPSVECRP